VPETAREYIHQRLAQGMTIDEIRADQAALNRLSVQMQVEMEHSPSPEDFLILDQGSPDHFVSCRISEVDPNDFLPGCIHRRYATVFILVPLRYVGDGTREKDASLVKGMDG